MLSAMRGRHVRVSAWSPTQKRDSPVSREMILMMGGRSLASVQSPFRLFARRRGGSVGSRWGVLFFPRVPIQFIGLKGGTGHHTGGRRRVQVGLDALSEGMQLFA